MKQENTNETDRKLFNFNGNVDSYLEAQRAILKQKREAAIEWLGDKWIMRGGSYTPKLTVLNRK